MTSTSHEDPRPRSLLGLLLSRGFGVFFYARLSTAIGVWLHGIVAAIAAFQATGSALVVGIVSFVQFAPQLVLGPVAGSWADQGNIKAQMLLGRAVSASGSLVIALWYALPLDLSTTADTIVIVVSSLAVGVGLVIGGPAMQSATPALVTRAELPTAMALNTAPVTLGRIAGPALGALTSAGFGFGWAFLVAGVGNVLFIVLIATVPFPAALPRKAGSSGTMREALVFVKNNRPLLLVLVGITALGFGSEPTVTLAPPLAQELGGETLLVGALTSSMGIGAAVGVVASSLAARHLRHDYTAAIGTITMAISLAVCAFPVAEPVALWAFGVSGFGFIVAVSSLSTLLQLRLPAELRGRVMALWLMGFVGARPVGSLLVGAISDVSTVYVAFGVVALVLVLCAAVCRPSQLRGQS